MSSINARAFLVRIDKYKGVAGGWTIPVRSQALGLALGLMMVWDRTYGECVGSGAIRQGIRTG